jgi:phenylpropionate dioxygenase-like ring-hydroxylating dioxygenase large terminal subunit
MTREILNHSSLPAQISNFDSARYVDTSYMEQEWQAIWGQTWLLAGLVSDVQEPGDFFVFDIGPEQILVSRSQVGDVQGFYNVCQHRGNRLVTAERGHASNFRCAYHAWTYNVDGELKSVPYEERFPQGVPCAERSLRKVHTQLWDGFVFVSLAAEPVPLLDFLGPVVDHLAPYRFGDMVLVEDQTVHHQCNWKAVVDNFSELYHVDFLHPQHKSMVDCCNDTVHLFEHGHTGLAVPGATVNPRFPVPEEPTALQSAQLTSLGLDPEDFCGRVLEVREAVQQRKREVGLSKGFDYSEFDAEQLSDVWQYNLFPNIILSFTPEHCWVMRVRPHPTDPQQCYFDKLSLLKYADPKLMASDQEPTQLVGPGREVAQADTVLAKSYTRPEHDVFGHEAILSGAKTMTDTIDQDIELLGGVQAGMASKGFDSVWLNDDEMRVQHFHNVLDSLIPAAD